MKFVYLCLWILEQLITGQPIVPRSRGTRRRRGEKLGKSRVNFEVGVRRGDDVLLPQSAEAAPELAYGPFDLLERPLELEDGGLALAQDFDGIEDEDVPPAELVLHVTHLGKGAQGHRFYVGETGRGIFKRTQFLEDAHRLFHGGREDLFVFTEIHVTHLEPSVFTNPPLSLKMQRYPRNITSSNLLEDRRKRYYLTEVSKEGKRGFLSL